MNKKKGVLGIAVFFAAVMFLFTGCQQPVETDNGSRDGVFEKDSLLIEVWDSSTPPKFLGYDTRLGEDGYYSSAVSIIAGPIILTSKGYCVALRRSYDGSKIGYGTVPYDNQGMDYDEWDEIWKNNGWGCAIFFATANPTANDTPYAIAMWGNNIVNNVFYNPHNGGTYYTRDRNATTPNITIQGNYKFYDNTGTMRSWNDDYQYFGENDLHVGSSTNYIGGSFYFTPLKKIGGYAEIGLPDPATTTYPWVYKVR